MEIIIDSELKDICKEILESKMSLEEWKKSNSEDMFQSDKYCGGFEKKESAFCFSLYSETAEYWFQFSLNDAEKIVAGELKSLTGRKATG